MPLCHKITKAGKRCRMSCILKSAFCKRHTYHDMSGIHSAIHTLHMIVLFRLHQLPQPEQRSEEWFEMRKGRITASEAGKCIIFDKHLADLAARGVILASPDKFKIGKSYCNPYESRNKYMAVKAGITPAPVVAQHFVEWGVCFEPVTTHIYELLNNTKVHEFGLLPHPSISFIGASPDGISDDLIMLEIKNPYTNRPVGAPAIYYWVQMQMQMEVADLDSCDFFDVRIRTFENKQAFLDDIKYEWKGCVVKTTKYDPVCDDDVTDYFYPMFTKPWCDQEKEIWEWLMKQSRNDVLSRVFGNIQTEIRYWYVDEMSCRRIERDKQWFHNVALPQLHQTWDDIQTLKNKTDEEFYNKVTSRLKHVKPFRDEVVPQKDEKTSLLFISSSDDEDEMPQFVNITK